MGRESLLFMCLELDYQNIDEYTFDLEFVTQKRSFVWSELATPNSQGGTEFASTDKQT